MNGALKHLHLAGAEGVIHALEFGSQHAGPPLLCLHGVTGSAWLWHGVAAALARRRRVIALDLRGHGASDWSAGHHYDTPAHMADLVSVADTLGLERFDLAGLSWGALIGIAYAARHPQRVGKLAIVDVEPSFAQSEHAVAPRPEHFASRDEVLAWERAANPRAPEALLRTFAYHSVRHADGGGWARQHDPYFFKCWPFRRDDLWAELPRLHSPPLLVHGERSFVRGAVMEEMAGCVLGARLLHLPDCGHLVPLEAPHGLQQALEEFLE